jgi:predicted TIM-barrel fold metal-dependent hydrolase
MLAIGCNSKTEGINGYCEFYEIHYTAIRNYRLPIYLMSTATALHPAKRMIVDAHHHFWDLSKNYHPWLRDEPPIAFRYGSYESIKKNYLMSDYLQDSNKYQIQGSVYVETEWDPSDSKGEVQYIHELRQSQALPTVAVMHVRLNDIDAAQKLEFQSTFDFVKSIRHKPKANAKPGMAEEGGMMDKAWRQGFEALSQFGLRFDLQTPWWHMHEAQSLAQDYPNTKIIINHSGLPADRSTEGIEAWSKAMKLVSQCPNVSVKISGIGVQNSRWTAQANGHIVKTLIDLFGIDRCMFASNFPVDKICASYEEIFTGFEEMVSDLTVGEQDKLFRLNAIRTYDMGLV